MDRARHYDPAAYHFVRQALDFSLSRLHKRRHITGQELLKSISRYAKIRFGPLARFVFEEWGILDTMDFGHIVFELVERGIMTKRPEDSIGDFKDGYDFKKEFDENYDYLTEIRRSWAVDSEAAQRPNSDPDSNWPA